jgi:hypothetical protein
VRDFFPLRLGPCEQDVGDSRPGEIVGGGLADFARERRQALWIQQEMLPILLNTSSAISP